MYGKWCKYLSNRKTYKVETKGHSLFLTFIPSVLLVVKLILNIAKKQQNITINPTLLGNLRYNSTSRFFRSMDSNLPETSLKSYTHHVNSTVGVVGNYCPLLHAEWLELINLLRTITLKQDCIRQIDWPDSRWGKRSQCPRYFIICGHSSHFLHKFLSLSFSDLPLSLSAPSLSLCLNNRLLLPGWISPGFIHDECYRLQQLSSLSRKVPG